jgi:hypothetical protein
MKKNLENIGPASETGRYTVTSTKTGKTYIVEPIGSGRPADWGSVNPATGKMEVKKGWAKYTGSITEEESILTKENGFDEVHYTGIGCSPMSLIEKLESENE